MEGSDFVAEKCQLEKEVKKKRTRAVCHADFDKTRLCKRKIIFRSIGKQASS
jgi:hypothetical protein